MEAEPVGGGPEDILEPLGRIAVAVQRPAELEDESDRGGIGLVPAAFGGRLTWVGHGGSG